MAKDEQESRFVEYKLVEVVTKLTTMIQKQRPIRIWKKGEKPFFSKLVDISKHLMTFEVEKLPDHDLLQGEEFHINFTFSHTDFFMKGEVLSMSNGIFAMEVKDSVFKAERRGNERLLTYPHMQVYAYLSMGEELEDETYSDNLLSFCKSNKMEDENLKDFSVNKKLERIPDAWSNEKGDGEVDLIGFRAMDLSTRGLSFCANLPGRENYFAVDENKLWQVYLLFNGDSFVLKDSKIIYCIDFVNPQSSIVPMKKIGMSFVPTDELTQKIYKYIEELTTTTELEKDFEKLVYSR